MAAPVVVITGSTKGLGLGMAGAFLSRGCRVVVSGRHPESVAQAIATLAQGAVDPQVIGFSCDVRDAKQVEALWDSAIEAFGMVDIWINNAAINSIEQDLWQQEVDTIDAVIHTNLLGTLYGTRVAVRGMTAQGRGQIYNLEGWGSGNERRRGSTLYGTSKAAIGYLSRSVAAELDSTPVQLGTINPGIVPTELLTLSIRPGQEAKVKRFINLFGDRVETVAPALVDRALANRANGRRIIWLSPTRMLGRLLLAPFRRRQIVD
jgi:NAD(P)-dependent dehydrogenase (short-subunit alcohol dehydrogenase family)